jgi:uncharacterized membrane protein
MNFSYSLIKFPDWRANVGNILRNMTFQNFYLKSLSSLLVFSGLLLWPDREAFFSNTGVLGRQIEGLFGDRLNLFNLVGSTPTAINMLFLLYFLFACGLVVSQFKQSFCIALIPIVSSLHHQNIFILSSADTLLRVQIFCGILIASKDKHGSSLGRTALKLQMTFIYLSTAYFKSKGIVWQNGSAVYYVLNQSQFFRFPIPEILRHSLPLSQILTWFTLAVEALGPILLWIPATRLIALITLSALHLGLAYALNIQLFQPLMLLGLSSFAKKADLKKLLEFTLKQKP